MGVKKFLKDAEDLQKKNQRRKEEHAPQAHGDDESNWLVSYADMMTLLCGFFIMLFSMAKLDDTKYEKMKEEVSKQFKGSYQAPPSSQIAQFVTQIIQEAGIQKDAVVTSDPNGVTVAFQSTVFFDTLSADVRSQGRIVLDRLIEGIYSHQARDGKQYKIVVEGHTDSRPILGGTFASNWELSGARAARVVRLFLGKGFTPDRLTAIGYGETRPVMESRRIDGSWDEEALSKNRRVVLRILEPRVDFIPMPESDKKPANQAVQQAAVQPLNPVNPTQGQNGVITPSSANPEQPAQAPTMVNPQLSAPAIPATSAH